jgi:PAS domain S-box-containing protein
VSGPSPAVPVGAATGSGERRARILWADDNADMREYVRRLLGRHHEVEAVADGLSALEAARARPPDLVLTDVMMPGLDGFALLRELRADERLRTVPVILLSARAGEEARVEGMHAGADDYLIKPFSARELLTRVEAHLKLQQVRRESQAALRESEAKFSTAFDASPLVLTITSLDDGRLVEVNEAFVRLAGYTRAEVVGRTPDELGLWIDPDRRVERFARLRVGERVPTIEARFRAKSGVEVIGLISSAVVEINGRPCVLSSVTDITDRKRAEEALQAADRAKDEFLAMLGHELRNPLGALASAARLLDREGGTPGVAARARDVIGRQLDHLTRLVDDLLDVSRLTTAKVRLSRRPLDLSHAARGAVETLRARGALDRHRLSFEGHPAWVDADETRIEQIVANLVGNAMKFTPPGGSITVTVGRDDLDAVLEVKDTGIGISAEALPRIFDLFVQGERTLDRAQGGLGIGLTLVRRLVELHGGTVQASSEVGKGSVFTVRLPAVHPPAVHEATRSGGQPAACRPRRVLIVEDNDDAREMLRVLLTHDGHEVHEAVDGPGGLQAALTLQPDIALVDVGLPGLDGYALARSLRAHPNGQRVVLVALTGYGQPEDRRRGEEAGFDAHVVKPVDPAQLALLLARS